MLDDINNTEENQIHIRHAYLEEYEAAVSVSLQSCQQSKGIETSVSRKTTAQWIRDATSLKYGGELLVATNHIGIVGATVYHTPNSMPAEVVPRNWASMSILTVLPDFRNNGIGKRLCTNCIDLARIDQAKYLGVAVSPEMVDAILFFEALGFVKTKYQKLLRQKQYFQYRFSVRKRIVTPCQKKSCSACR
ncbi:MAG: hypothetical protein CMM58_13295 [Rhodospirillaceae bacterium]|nr:hypothetical protein [Rhodospirillaceae bacterium]|tara:strand:+ start:3763 stop:4335 length:573 start_codon:yes stop_codon:yes gene_type:complete